MDRVGVSRSLKPRGSAAGVRLSCIAGHMRLPDALSSLATLATYLGTGYTGHVKVGRGADCGAHLSAFHGGSFQCPQVADVAGARMGMKGGRDVDSWDSGSRSPFQKAVEVWPKFFWGEQPAATVLIITGTGYLPPGFQASRLPPLWLGRAACLLAVEGG